MTGSPRALNPDELLDWLRLIRTEQVGPVGFYALLQRFGSAAAALDALPRLAARGGRGRPLAIPGRGEAERELAAVAKVGARLVAWGEPDYPAALMEVEDAPPLLSLRGRTESLRRPAVAVVGARNASANGRRLAREIAADLARAGVLVVSGLARGIDSAAHQGALDGGTAAVLAGGIEIVYPEENRDLHAAIGERGVLVAEMPVGTEPQARHFPRRNRIISGLALGVVVVEAAARSGSLITARLAGEQGREIFAVPGSPLDPRCRGTNDLLRGGATLTESAEDVFEKLRGIDRPARLRERPRPIFEAPRPAPADDSEVESARRIVLEQLAPSPVEVDEVLRQCQLSPAIVATVLLELELAGRIERHPGNRVSLL